MLSSFALFFASTNIILIKQPLFNQPTNQCAGVEQKLVFDVKPRSWYVPHVHLIVDKLAILDSQLIFYS